MKQWFSFPSHNQIGAASVSYTKYLKQSGLYETSCIIPTFACTQGLLNRIRKIGAMRSLIRLGFEVEISPVHVYETSYFRGRTGAESKLILLLNVRRYRDKALSGGLDSPGSGGPL
jgi:hypothetical protein